jgi:putative acetyltransferase
MNMIEIIAFEERYENDFRQLNLEWLEEYHLTEAHDMEILNDPQGTIIHNGGYIFLARYENTIAGCAGLIKVNDDEYELVKMTVGKDFRGKGISKQLLNHCLEKAKELNAKKISLLSNHQLETALCLYKQFGFKDVPVGPSPYDLADVKMELSLTDLS